MIFIRETKLAILQAVNENIKASWKPLLLGKWETSRGPTSRGTLNPVAAARGVFWLPGGQAMARRWQCQENLPSCSHPPTERLP